MAYTFTEEGSEILKKYGIETQSQPQQAQKQPPQVDMSKGVGGVGTGIRQSIKGENWVEALGRNAEAGVRYRKKAEEEVAKLGRGADYQLRGANFSDSGRQILAKYGLADYTDDELIDMSMWEQRRADYYGEVGDAYKHLGGTEWSDWMMDQRYSSAVDYRIQELEQEMERVGKNSPAYAEMQEYHAMLLRMKEGYTGRREFFGQFSSEAAYDAYGDVWKEMGSSRANGLDYNDVYLRYQQDAAQAENRAIELEDRLTEAKRELDGEGWLTLPDGTVLQGEALGAYVQQLEAEVDEANRAYNTAQMRVSWAQMARYTDLPQKEDWNDQVAAGREQMYALQEQERQRREQEAAETRAGNTEVAGLDDTQLSGSGYLTYRIPDGTFTKEQQDTWCYLYMRSPEEAYEYAIEVYRNNKNQTRAERMQEFSDWAGQNVGTRLAATAYNLVSWPTALWDVMGNLAEYGNTGLVMPRDDLSPSDWGDAMQAGVASYLNNIYTLPEDWAIIGGKGLGDAYQLGMSIAQSMEVAWAGGGVANVLFFGTAAKHGTEEALARGATDGQALVYGMLCGAAEVLGETISIEHLVHMKDPATAMRLLKNVLIQGGIEASEEAFTTLLTTAADAIVMGDKSALNQRVQELILQGMSREEAEKKAAAEWFEGVMQDALGGFLSGGISGGIQSGIRYHQSNTTTYDGDQQALLDLAKQQGGEGSDVYNLALEIEQKGAMSQHDANRLEDAMPGLLEMADRQRSSASRTQVRETAERRLMEEGVEQSTARRMAESITKDLMGDKLSRTERAEQRSVYQNQTAQQVAQEIRQQRRMERVAHFVESQSRLDESRNKKKKKGKGSFEVSASVGTAQKESAVTVKGQEGESKIEALTRGENGELLARVKSEAGEERTVPVSEIDFGESGMDELVRELQKQEDGPAMFMAYSSGIGIGTFINGWNTAKAYGRNTSRASAESIMDDGLLEGLPQDMIRAAFNYGRRLQEQDRAQRQEEREKETQDDSKGSERAAEGVGPYEKGEAKGAKSNKGGVSYEGGTVDGVKLKAVNKNRLNPRQRAQIEAVDMLGKTLGVRFVLFESDLKSRSGVYANGMYKDGVIYLDVNAGRHGQSLSQVAMVRTAAHELTHYMQDYAENRYDELKQFLLDHLIEWKGKDLGELAAQKMQRDRTGKLSMEDALDEVVADGCEMMLRRTKVMQTMAAENKGLFRTVKNWLQKWLGTIKEAFMGVSEVHEEARAVAEMETERLEKLVELWDKGLREAAENAQKSPAKEGGAVKYQARDEYDPETATIKIQIENSKSVLNSMNPAAEKEVPYFKKGEKNKAAEWAIQELKKKGYHVDKLGFGTIFFDKNDIDQAARYADTPAEKAALALIYDVLKRGIEIGRHEDHDKRGKRTITFGAPVVLNGQRGNMAVVVNMRSNHFYAERIVLPDGSAFVLPEKKNAPQDLPRGVVQTDSLAKATSGGSNNSILPPPKKSNTKFQERDELPDDRALLMQAEAEGRNAEELTAYQKKVKSLEALERKLQRQQEALEELKGKERIDTASESTGVAMTDEGKSKAAEQRKAAIDGWVKQIQKTEASIRRAENKLNEMERSPELRQETQKALAAWRDANPQEAAKAIRAMREEQESLKRYVELLREEATLTTPETRRMLPSDINKMARALLKQYGSRAAVDSISEKLQKLGDFMASNLEGADTGYYVQIQSMARKIAQEIVEQSYEEIDDQKDIREGIRDFLKNHKLRISEDVRGDIPDFEQFRRRNLGTLRLGNEGMDIDQAYTDLQRMYGEAFFPDVTARSDQLLQILDTLEGLRPLMQQSFPGVQAWEASESIGNEIIDRLLSGEVRERETMADKAFQRKMRELEAKYASKDKARQQALNDAEDQMKWERAKRDEAEERRREERALRRQLVEEKVHELRERSIERDKKYRARISIDKKVVALSKIMLENSGKRHVPDAWKESIGGFLSSIDTLTEHSGEESRAFHLERIEALQKMVAQQQARNEGRDTGDDGPQVFMDMNPYLQEMLDPFVTMARNSDTGRLTVSRMELEQMNELEEVLTALREAVDKANSMLADSENGTVTEIGGETVTHLKALGKGKTGGMIRRFLSWENLTPVYFFKRFGPAGEKIFRSLQRGWGKLAFNARQIIDFSENTYTAKEARAWEKETHEFQLVKRESDLSGRKSLTKAAAEGGAEAARKAEEENREPVTMSTAQIMGLYCLVKREQALGHILSGGIRIWDISSKRGTTEQAERYLVSAEDIATICGTLTERQREVADALQKYMNTVGSAWGNEVSRARFGVDLFTEKNYYPIETDPKSRNARNPEADGTDLFRILNMGFTKSTVKGAKNGVVLHSIFDVFSNHMADMAKYNSMGLPMLDAMKWINYLDESDGVFVSVRAAMETAYGKNAERYFLTFMQDLNGSHEGGRRGEDIGSRMVSHAKVAAVGGNLRVAALQPTSYVRALAVLDPKYLLKGDNLFKIKQGIREAQQYSGTAVWKDLGFYDMNINANMRDLIKHTDGALEKIREASMIGAELGDKTTWGRLWNATKAEVKAKTGLSGEALMKATAERFDDVIYQTQVMDSTMTRSHMMRQKGLYAGMVTSFMSEPTLSYNLVLNAVTQWQNARRSGEGTKEASKLAARAFAVYAISQIAASLVESIFDALRDDDDYESLWEKWKQSEFGWDGNLVQDLVLHNKLPYVRDVISIVQGFSNKRMDTEWVEYLTRAYSAVKKALEEDENGERKGFTWGTAYTVMRALSTITGLPVSNTARDAIALWNGIVVQSVPDWKLKTIKTSEEKPQAGIKQAYLSGALSDEEAIRYLMRDADVESEDRARQLLYEWGLEKGHKKYDDLLAAVRSGDSTAGAEWQKLLDNGYSEKTLQSAVRTAVKEWYQGTADNGPRMNKQAAIEALVKYGGMRRKEAEETVQEWTAYVSSPEKLQYDEIRQAYVDGEITPERAVEMRVLYGGQSQTDAEKEVNTWRCEKETGIAYNDLNNAYLDGEITQEEAVRCRTEYGGQSQTDAEKEVNTWRCEKETGIRYEDIQYAYTSGQISSQQVRTMLTTYGGKDEDEAEGELMRYDYIGTNPNLDGSSAAEATRYYTDLSGLGIDKETWHEIWHTGNSITADKDENGKTVTDSRLNKVAAYIDSFNISPAAKDALFLQFYSSKSLRKTPWHR